MHLKIPGSGNDRPSLYGHGANAPEIRRLAPFSKLRTEEPKKIVAQSGPTISSRSSRFRILPAGLRGSGSVRMSMRTGTLKAAKRDAT